MPDAKHTPGPWAVHEDAHEERLHIRSGVHGAIHIAEVGNARTDSDWLPINEANARLIAAAPELLAALQAVLNGPLVHLDGTVEPIVLAAIAKATGGTNG